MYLFKKNIKDLHYYYYYSSTNKSSTQQLISDLKNSATKKNTPASILMSLKSHFSIAAPLFI